MPLETAEAEAGWDAPTAPPPDFAHGLLHQKLQMLNCCILAKARLEQRAHQQLAAPQHLPAALTRGALLA